MTKHKVTVVFFLVAITLSAIGQRFFVKFSAGNPDVPDGWPSETSNPTAATNVPAGWATNWTVAQVEARKASLQSSYDAIQAAKANTIATNKDAKIKQLADLFQDFNGWETDWANGTNFTAAQMQVMLRKHNGAFILMKPFLKELYDARQ